MTAQTDPFPATTSGSTEPEDPKPRAAAAPGRRVTCPKTGIVYELGEQIGAGAAAVVYRCRQVVTNSDGLETLSIQEMAAKVMNLRGLRLRGDYTREREKLRREVSILSRLHHPCIVNLLHVIETKDELFLMMELVKGGELFDKIIDRGALTEDQARYVLLQILSALEYMHHKGIIHRDLKPENILVSSESAPGFFRIQVADFGLAKLVRSGISEAKTFVGTPQYWAPEVIDSSSSNQIYGREADLWSLGCVIYVMLGGSYPFDSRIGPIDLLIKNAQYHFRYPRFQRVSDEAKGLIRSLLTVDPDQRMSLEQLFRHPWLAQYSVPPGVPQLPALQPLASEDFADRPFIAGMSVLDGSTTSDPPPLPSLNTDNSVVDNPTVEKEDKSSKAIRLYHPPKSHFAAFQRMYQPTPASENLNAFIYDWAQSGAASQPADQAPWNKLPSPSATTRLPPASYTQANSSSSSSSSSSSKHHSVANPFTFPPFASPPTTNDIPAPGPFKRDEAVRAAESLFNFEELLCLQVFIMRKFHWASIALRTSPEASKLVRKAIWEGQNLQQESVHIIRQFEITCSSVISIFPDLALAVSENQPKLAIDLFDVIRGWIAQLKRQVESHQRGISNFSHQVSDLLEAIRAMKISADQQYASGGVVFSGAITDGEAIPRVESVPSVVASRNSSESSPPAPPDTQLPAVSEPPSSSTTPTSEKSTDYSSCADLNFQVERASRYDDDFYANAVRTSEVLVRALDEIRRIDHILSQCGSVWLNMAGLFERICQMKTHTERLLQYSANGPLFAQRFLDKLQDYHQFWSALRDHSRRYVSEAEAKARTLQESALALENTADRVETANAMQVGQSVMRFKPAEAVRHFRV